MGMNNHVVWSNFDVFFLLFGHPRLSGSLQTVRHDIYKPKPLQKASLLCFRKRILRVGSGEISREKGNLKLAGSLPPHPPPVFEGLQTGQKKMCPVSGQI